MQVQSRHHPQVRPILQKKWAFVVLPCWGVNDQFYQFGFSWLKTKKMSICCSSVLRSQWLILPILISWLKTFAGSNWWGGVLHASSICQTTQMMKPNLVWSLNIQSELWQFYCCKIPNCSWNFTNVAHWKLVYFLNFLFWMKFVSDVAMYF